ncbi:MAG: hypothetical protein WDN00_02710 [Limisphaerales bacterium]
MKISLLLFLLFAPQFASCEQPNRFEAQTNSAPLLISTNIVQDTSQVLVPEPSEKAMSFYLSAMCSGALERHGIFCFLH